MLPFGADMATLLQRLDTARRSLWLSIDAVNQLNKNEADTRFAEFRDQLAEVSKETDRLKRESRLYSQEFIEGERDGLQKP